MSKRVVIKASSRPMPSPVLFLVVVALVLDRCQSPGWAWGIAGTIGALLIGAFIADRFNIVERDVPGFGPNVPSND